MSEWVAACQVWNGTDFATGGTWGRCVTHREAVPADATGCPKGDPALPVHVERKVSMDELREIWDDFSAEGVCYNGMTSVALERRYPGRVYHKPGVGWFVRPDASA